MPRLDEPAPVAGRVLGALVLGALVLGALVLGALAPATAQPDTRGAPDVDVLSVSAALPAKERLTVFFSILNDGPGAIRDVEVDARARIGSAIVILGQTQLGLGSIEENESAVLALRIATGEREGAAGVILAISFLDAEGTARSITREVTLQIGAERSGPLRMRYVADTLAAGGEGVLELVAVNPSSQTLRDLTVELDLSSAAGSAGANSPGGASPLSLLDRQADLTPGAKGDRLAQGVALGPGGSLGMEAAVRAGLRADDLVPFGVTATYTIDGFERSQRFDFGARVEGPVRFRVLGLREEVSGGARELSGTLVNMGPGTAWSPRLGLREGSAFDAGEGILIEDLKPNEPASFRLPVERAAEGGSGGEVGLVLEWNDDAGRVRTDAVPATARVLPEESAEPSLIARLAGQKVPIALALVALAAVAAALVRKRLRRDA